MQEALDRSLTPKEKEQFYNQLNDLLFDGDLTKLSDPKKTEAFVKDLSKKGPVTPWFARREGSA